MNLHYDTGLRSRLPANNNGSGVVLNRAFSGWEDCIETSLKDRSHTRESRYQSKEDTCLLELCREHAMSYRRLVEGHNTVMLTHPFYLHMSHMHELDTEAKKKEAQEYLDALFDFLRLERKGKARIVVLETVHHYAAATSLLLEEGLIDTIIFTLYDYGHPLDTNELDPYREGNIYFGGGYNRRCLSHSISDMMRKAPEERIWVMYDLVLDSPHDLGATLKPKTIASVDSSRVISLESAIKKLDLSRR